MSLLVSPESKVESTSKSKSHEAADVTSPTASLTILDEVSHLEESVTKKDFRTIAVPNNFSDELSEVTREKVLDFLRERDLDPELVFILQSILTSLDRINETLSTVTEFQSKLYNQTVDFQIKSERNQEHMMNLLENLSHLFEEKVEAEVARQLAKKEKTKTNNRVSKATTADRDQINETHELSEMTREVVLSSLGGRALNSKLEALIHQSMPKSLDWDQINETLSTVTECQSREEVVLSSLGGRALNSELEAFIHQSMPKSLDRDQINETLSTVTECQSREE